MKTIFQFFRRFRRKFSNFVLKGSTVEIFRQFREKKLLDFIKGAYIREIRVIKNKREREKTVEIAW